jgi:hypothetical protein
VQVDPVKPKLKPPGIKRLKLNCDVLLSTSSFNFNLRRYTEAKIRQLFASAAAAAPCIIFIDEVDAIVPKREAGPSRYLSPRHRS